MTAIAAADLPDPDFADHRHHLARGINSSTRTAFRSRRRWGSARSGRGPRAGFIASTLRSLRFRTAAGSRVSADASPIRLAHRTIDTRTPAGNMNTHGTSSPTWCRRDQGAQRHARRLYPETRSSSPVSARIAAPTFSAVSMMSDGDVGDDVAGDDPPTRHTYVACGLDRIRVAARLIVASPDHAGTDHPTEGGQQHDQRATLAEFLVRGLMIAIRMKPGTTSSRSTIHMSRRSRQPKYPATDPAGGRDRRGDDGHAQPSASTSACRAAPVIGCPARSR